MEDLKDYMINLCRAAISDKERELDGKLRDESVTHIEAMRELASFSIVLHDLFSSAVVKQALNYNAELASTRSEIDGKR